MRFELSDDEFAQLSTFDLRWRWTEEKYDLLEAAEQARIRPLVERAAKRAFQFSSGFHGSDLAPRQPLFGAAQPLDRPHQNDDATAWLRSRLPVRATPILVSWSPSWAVMTDTDLFCDYWETFCYPASDDISIWPLDVTWIAAYWHEEYLWFVNRRLADGVNEHS